MVNELELLHNNYYLLRHPKYHSTYNKSKHIDTRYDFTSEKVPSQEIILQFSSISDMAVDIFTKSIPAEKYQHCMPKLGMCLIP